MRLSTPLVLAVSPALAVLATVACFGPVSLKGHAWEVRLVQASPDGTLLASACDEAIRVWDAATGRSLAVCRGFYGGVRSLAFSPDGQALASTDRDGWAVRVWDAATGRERLALWGHVGGATSAAFSPDGRTLATAGSWDGTVRV